MAGLSAIRMTTRVGAMRFVSAVLLRLLKLALIDASSRTNSDAGVADKEQLWRSRFVAAPEDADAAVAFDNCGIDLNEMENATLTRDRHYVLFLQTHVVHPIAVPVSIFDNDDGCSVCQFAKGNRLLF